MEANKLETIIKEKIEARTMQPSTEVWDRLDVMLTSAEKPKRSYSWLYIAASFVGLLLIGTIYFNGLETGIIDKGNPVVQEQKTDKSNLEKPETLKKEVFRRQIQIKTANENKVANSDDLKKQPKQLSTKKEEILLVQTKVNTIIVNSTKENMDQFVSSTKYISAEKLLAEVSNTKFEAKAADKTIEKTRKSAAVDPGNLLSSVEIELDQSFKESALQKFNKKFNAIKIAVANRNYEE
jgi:hypothetical protein